jgi:hypothetical protein
MINKGFYYYFLHFVMIIVLSKQNSTMYVCKITIFKQMIRSYFAEDYFNVLLLLLVARETILQRCF